MLNPCGSKDNRHLMDKIAKNVATAGPQPTFCVGSTRLLGVAGFHNLGKNCPSALTIFFGPHPLVGVTEKNLFAGLIFTKVERQSFLPLLYRFILSRRLTTCFCIKSLSRFKSSTSLDSEL